MGDEEGEFSDFSKEECEKSLFTLDTNLGYKLFKWCATSCGVYESFVTSKLSSEETSCLETCGTNFMNWKNTIQLDLIERVQANYKPVSGGGDDDEDDDD